MVSFSKVVGNNSYFILLLLLFLHLILLWNTKFTVWPEMVLYPWLMNNGFLLYKDIINPYFPFLPLVLSFVFALIGSDIFSLKLFTWVFILVCDLVVFYCALRLTQSKSKSLLSVLTFV